MSCYIQRFVRASLILEFKKKYLRVLKSAVSIVKRCNRHDICLETDLDQSIRNYFRRFERACFSKMYAITFSAILSYSASTKRDFAGERQAQLGVYEGGLTS